VSSTSICGAPFTSLFPGRSSIETTLPHAIWDRVHVYVDVPPAHAPHGLMEVAARADWPPGDSGRLVLLAPYYTTSVWEGVRPIGQLPVVSDLQLVLDLWHYPVRGREHAKRLIEMKFPAK
jgi:hypothetical protein